ncbi:MAG: 30S ribosomal protein S17 [Deltaproteobacteria bacterium]|nr:30S ribosomal protein S17 [Deltaproteobacteria bacterium]
MAAEATSTSAGSGSSAGRRRTLRGRVVSDKMDKTVVVEVERTYQHRTIHKYVKTTKKYKAHDEANACKVGDLVVIEESRPLSRTKRWVVVGGAS